MIHSFFFGITLFSASFLINNSGAITKIHIRNNDLNFGTDVKNDASLDFTTKSGLPIYSCLQANSDTLVLHPSADEFLIQDLEKPTKPLPQVSSKDLYQTLNAKDIAVTSPMPDSVVSFGQHPFLYGMWTAYQEHRPIVLSPDIFWTLIEQGFARHISYNAEKFRDRLVDFDGKRELTVVLDSPKLSAKELEKAIPFYIDQIESFTGKDFVESLISDFSTTTPEAKLVSQIILLESVKSFFDYRMIIIGCGISSVTVEGTVEDWEKILTKLYFIETFELKDWVSQLRPVIEKIVETKRGNVDKEFWKNMVQQQGKAAYSPHKTIDGWITKFYPFDDKNEPRQISPITHVNSIAAEHVRVPFILEDRVRKTEKKMEMLAGIISLEQDMRHYKVKPLIGWAVVGLSEEKAQAPTRTQYDIVDLKNIKQIPNDLYSIERIERLTLHFLGKVNIPNEISKISISTLQVVGQMSNEDKERLKKLLPNTHILYRGDLKDEYFEEFNSKISIKTTN